MTLEVEPSSDRPDQPDVAMRPGPVKIALALTYLSAFATPWNGLAVVGLRPGDLFLLLALASFASASIGRRIPGLPPWAWFFGGVIAFVTLLHLVHPVDARYLSGRLVLDAAGVPIPSVYSNLDVGAKFLVPALGMPLLFAFARTYDGRAVHRAGIAFAAGSALSAGIAFADLFLGTGIAAAFGPGLGAGGGRATGLSVHPNFLAVTCVLSIPFVLWLLPTVHGRLRVASAAGGFLLLLGLYASGSRSGAAVGVGAVLAIIILLPAYRRALPSVLLTAAGIGVVAFVANPSLGAAVLRAVRLDGEDSNAAGSDLIRTLVRQQGFADYHESPLFGVGMQVAGEAHNVYLQALASGGTVLLLGYVVFVLGGLVRAIRATRVDSFAYALTVAIVAGVLLSTVTNALTDRLAYLPVSLAAAIVVPPLMRARDDTMS